MIYAVVNFLSSSDATSLDTLCDAFSKDTKVSEYELQNLMATNAETE